MAAIVRSFRDGLMIHAAVFGLGLLLEVLRRRDARIQRALTNFSACYQFRTPHGAARRLIFAGGRARTRAGLADAPDYEVVLLDPPAVVEQLARDPDDVVRLLLENKIDQRGNPYYLFKLGYLMGLCERRLRGLIPARLRS